MDDNIRTERDTRKFRLLALLLVVAGVYFERQEVALWPAIALAGLYLLHLVVFFSVIVRWVPPRLLPYGMLWADVGFVGGTLYLFGVDSAFFVFFPIVVFYYALSLGYVGGFVASTLFAFAYIGVAFGHRADLLLGRLLPVQIPLFYLIALFGGYLGQQRKRAQSERQELVLLLQAERSARSMLDLTLGMASVLDLQALLGQIAHVCVSATGCTHGGVALVDEPRGVLGGAFAIFPAPRDEDDHTRCAEPGATTTFDQEAHTEGRLLEVGNPAHERLPHWARSLAPAYALFVPLSNGKGSIGVLTLLSTEPHSGLSPAQKDLLQVLAAFFYPLVSSARAYGSAQRQSERLSSELRGTVLHIVRTQQLQKRGDVRVGQLLLDPPRQRALLGSRQLELSEREFDVLYLLAQHAGVPVSQEVLLREVWGEESQARSNVVDVAINRLRRKLTLQAAAGELIQTVRGTGYMLDADNAVLSRDGVVGDVSLRALRRQGQRGALLLEHIISLAIVSVLVPALLTALTTVINNSDYHHDRVVAAELARSQLESVHKETFQTSPAAYSLISPLPDGYAISITTDQATAYTYSTGGATPEVLQAVTVTVAGRYGDLQVSGYKVRP
ncbi:MAG: winged helix-turn-helix domain-containing protein [Chloroflexi bacterium]|nr:winged helix-turn-helix domain-containing protein [Chloroflexota bacterium]